jgi:thiol:disulfide interchange protein
VAVTYEELQQQLAARRGAIVVVDLWATWCLPCLERFPHMVQLWRQYSEQGVRFVSLCLDDPEDAAALTQARRFLAASGAGFDHFLMNEVVTDAFEKLDLLGIPAVFVYDADGTLRHRLTGDDPRDQFTDEDVDEAIRELLATG